MTSTLGGGGGKRCARRETVDQLGFRPASSSRGIGLGAESKAFVSVAARGARGGACASRDMRDVRVVPFVSCPACDVARARHRSMGRVRSEGPESI